MESVGTEHRPDWLRSVASDGIAIEVRRATGLKKLNKILNYMYADDADQSYFKNVILLLLPYLGAIQEHNKIWVF